jgi:hypothetical protein
VLRRKTANYIYIWNHSVTPLSADIKYNSKKKSADIVRLMTSKYIKVGLNFFFNLKQAFLLATSSF